MNTAIEGLADLIAKELEAYSEAVTEELVAAVDVVSQEVNEEIKSHVTFTPRSGKYVKAFRIKKGAESRRGKTNVWHVANGQHRLTHLLEKGHALRQGGRTRAYPHIQYGEDLAKKRMEELAKEAVKRAGR